MTVPAERPPLPPDAFRAELAAAIPHIRRLAKHLTRNWDDALDLTQATMLRALESRRQYRPRPGTPLVKWLSVICFRLFCSGHRRAREHPTALVYALYDHGIAADQESTVYLGEVRARLTALPPEYARTVLFAARGDSYSEIAAATGVPEGTVRSRLCRARQALATFDKEQQR